ncbi:6,7-dimethyl-8-ribityllumazine synthase, partial [Senegalimassilia anaerobia]
MAVNIIEGKVINEGMKVGIVCARFNEFITSKLLGGALDALRR